MGRRCFPKAKSRQLLMDMPVGPSGKEFLVVLLIALAAATILAAAMFLGTGCGSGDPDDVGGTPTDYGAGDFVHLLDFDVASTTIGLGDLLETSWQVEFSSAVDSYWFELWLDRDPNGSGEVRIAYRNCAMPTTTCDEFGEEVCLLSRDPYDQDIYMDCTLRSTNVTEFVLDPDTVLIAKACISHINVALDIIETWCECTRVPVRFE